jgi:hypothetical protein
MAGKNQNMMLFVKVQKDAVNAESLTYIAKK